MDDLPGGRGQRDPKVLRLSHHYAACPACQLILPLYDDSDAAAGHHVGADGRDGVLPLQVARCGLCKHPLDTATPWPLDLKLGCPDCGALIRAPRRGGRPGLSGLRPLLRQSQQLSRGSPAGSGDPGRAGPHRRVGQRPGPAAGAGPGRG